MKILYPHRYISGTIQIAGIAGLLWALFQDFAWQWWAAAYGMHMLYYIVGAGVGHHRYFSHRSFEVNAFWHYFITACSILGTNTSPNVYRAVHLKHHRLSDRPGDPHHPEELGWRPLLFYNMNHYQVTPREYYRHTNPETDFIFRYFYGFHLLWVIFLALISPTAALFLYLIPQVLSMAGNALAMLILHKWGYRNHEIKDKSTNAWMMWPLMFGEVWHNNHHAKPSSPYSGEKWWELDPCSWFIFLVRKRPASKK